MTAFHSADHPSRLSSYHKSGEKNIQIQWLVNGLRRGLQTGEMERRDGPGPIGPSLLIEIINLPFGRKTLPIVARGLAPFVEDEAKSILEGAVDTLKREAIASNMTLLARSTEVMEHLRAQSIPAILMKGPVQQHYLYGDYFVRRSSDIDILVHQSDFRRSLEALRQIGYQKINRSPFLWWDVFVGERHLQLAGAQSWSVDLHHRVQAPGSQQPHAPSDFIASADTHSFRGTPLPTLHPKYIPLLSAMSLVKALRRREPAANHACDLLIATRGSGERSVEAFLALADSQDLRGTAILALRAVSTIFSVQYPHVAAEIEAMLPELSDEELAVMVLTPSLVVAWPKQTDLLRAVCGGDRARLAREMTWFGVAELSRKFEKVFRIAAGMLAPR